MPSTIEKIRARNLRHLCGPDHGGQADMAKKLGKSEAQLSALIGGHKNLGSRQARDIERKLELPTGWLDSEYHDLTHEGAEIGRWFQGLSPEQKHAFLTLLKPSLK